MRQAWLHQHKKDKLIIFCNGWGMDEGPVSHLASTDFDVLMLYGYHDLTMPLDIDQLSSRYSDIFLIGWSMGVWVGQKLFHKYRTSFSGCLAINGTLCPIDDKYGIPINIFNATLDGFSEVTRLKFYRRMCREKSNLKKFLSSEPKRSLEDQEGELTFLLLNTECLKLEQSIYDSVVIADYDWIVPSENQKRFWRESRSFHLPAFHYLFPLYQSWDHLIRLSKDSVE